MDYLSQFIQIDDIWFEFEQMIWLYLRALLIEVVQADNGTFTESNPLVDYLAHTCFTTG